MVWYPIATYLKSAAPSKKSSVSYGTFLVASRCGIAYKAVGLEDSSREIFRINKGKALGPDRNQPAWRLSITPDVSFLWLQSVGKVSKLSGGPTALIVDDDLGFVYWIAERFHEAGYQPVPALNVRQAVSLINELDLKISVVVVNAGLRSIRKFIKTLNQTQSPLAKIILIRDPCIPTTVVVRAHAIVERPSGWEPVSRHEWLRKLRRILSHADETVSITKITGHPPPKR
jgi:hypothetical protein